MPVEISEGKNPGTYDFYISPVSNKINSFNTIKSLDLTKDDLIKGVETIQFVCGL
jgi:hypothetical protein